MQTDDLGQLEEFISGTHQANLQQCGDRCYGETMYEAARILFQAIPNWGRLASTLVRLRRYGRGCGCLGWRGPEPFVFLSGWFGFGRLGSVRVGFVVVNGGGWLGTQAGVWLAAEGHGWE